MAGPDVLVIPITREEDIIVSRQQGRDLAKALGFRMVDQSRIATAISELTRNIIRYAGRGQCLIHAIERDGRTGIEVVCQDDGPGIPDVEAAMQDGFSTADRGGLGIGLPGTRRLMDEMHVDSAVGVGTTVVIRKWRKS